jgi:hypothetical protein
MRKGRSAAITATIACLVAAPLAVAGYSAHADELSDLRANQELLQRRLDQLAQATSTTGGGVARSPEGGPQVGAAMSGGSFPRSFLIPGTDTSIRIGGEIRENLLYSFNGANPNASPQTTNFGATGQSENIPLHVHTGGPPGFAAAGNTARSRGNDVFQQTAAQSKLSVETRTPTAWGEARTYMEFDWSGSNGFIPGGARGAQGTSSNQIPRLRFAYGTLGGLLFGQANSNFSDPDGSAEVIDFGGNFGDPGFTRVSQVRYTMPLAGWGLLGAVSVSAETPETDAALPGFGLIGSDAGAVTAPAGSAVAGAVVSSPITNPTKAHAPELTMAWYIPQSWGHTDFSAVLRPGLQLKDGLFVDRSYVGWGIHWGGDVKPGWFGWKRDDITWQFVYGDGIGRYLNSSTNFALATNYPALAAPGARGATNVLARTTVEWGGNVGYLHRWSDTLRSSISAGINHHDVYNGYRTVSAAGTTTGVAAYCSAAAGPTGGGTCGLNKELISAHANLIWNPVPFGEIGIEYSYGHRLVLGGIKGDENTVISRFRMQF